MTKSARFQVSQTQHGFVVKDSRDGSIWTKTYVRLGWAIRKASLLNEIHDRIPFGLDSSK